MKRSDFGEKKTQKPFEEWAQTKLETKLGENLRIASLQHAKQTDGKQLHQHPD